jgi:hypothetical protein
VIGIGVSAYQSVNASETGSGSGGEGREGREGREGGVCCNYLTGNGEVGKERERGKPVLVGSRNQPGTCDTTASHSRHSKRGPLPTVGKGAGIPAFKGQDRFKPALSSIMGNSSQTWRRCRQVIKDKCNGHCDQRL